MSYIEKNLTSNENIIHRAYISDLYVYGRPLLYLGIAILLGIAASTMMATTSTTSQTIGETITGMMGVTIGVFCLPTFFILRIPLLIIGLVMRKTTEVALTNQRVILKWGLIRRHTIETYLDKIEGIVVNQGILGRLLGYGSLLARGTGGGTNPCPGIKDPQAFRQQVNEQIQKKRFS